MAKKFALLAVLMMLVAAPEVHAQIVPEFYGWYVREDSAYKQLSEEQVTWRSGLRGVCAQWGMEGVPTEPKFTVSGPKPAFVAYQQEIDVRSVRLGRLTFVNDIEPSRLMKTPPDPQFFQNLCGVSYSARIPLRLWMLTETIPVNTGPIPGNPGMFRIQPAEELSNGVYVLFGGDFVGVARIRDVARKIVVPFRLSGGANAPAAAETPAEQAVGLNINRALLAEELSQDGDPIGVTDRFSSAVRTMVCYVAISGEREGQVIEFVWVQPNGRERARTSTTTSAPNPRQDQPVRLFGREIGRRSSNGQQFLYSTLTPRTLLQPGRWRCDVYVDGALAKTLPFIVY